MTNDELETIKERARAVARLVEAGATEGERAAAEAALARLLKRYGLTVADLLDPRNKPQRYSFTFKDDWEKKLLIQVIGKVRGVGELEYGNAKNQNRRKAKVIFVDLTPVEYAEVSYLYLEYVKAFREEFAVFLTAFIHKNKLVAPKGSGGRQLSDEELARLRSMMKGVREVPVGRKALADSKEG